MASWALHEVQLGVLNFELFSAYACDFELFNFELFNSKLKTQNRQSRQFKTQNSKLKIANGNNSKLKTQNSKLNNDFSETLYSLHQDRNIQFRWRLCHAVAYTQRGGGEERMA